MEEWKAIECTNGMYEISSEGRVRSMIILKSGNIKSTILKHQFNKKGYPIVRVTVNRVKMTIRIHREVARAFIDNPENKPQVNHKDGNKENNSVSNLEWCTNTENAHHAIANNLWENVFAASKRANEKQKKPIIATDISTGKTYSFPSMRAAENFTNTRHINEVIKGKRKQANGYSFAYERG